MIGPLPREDTPAIRELITQPFWVVWEPVERGDKTTKEPMSVAHYPVSITDPASWNKYEDVASKVVNLQWAGGLGFCFAEENDYCGIDIDKCIDPETKVIQPHALKTIKEFNSYTEYSVSGTGLHIIIKGKLSGKGRRQGGYEIYDKGRFFVMTGDHIEGYHDSIQSRQIELDRFIMENFKPEEKPSTKEWKSTDDFIFSEAADPPKEKHNALLKNSKEYQRIWERSYTQKEMSDTTLSGYDYKLIYTLLEVEWKPQEIYDTVIAFRRQWCQGDRDGFLKVAPKNAGGRDDYFINTYNKVAERVKSGLPQPYYDLSEAIQVGGKVAREKFNEITKLNIDGIIQRGLPSTYLIKINGATVPIGTAKSLFSPHEVQCALFDYEGKGIPPKVKKMWHEVCELLFTFAEVEMGEEFNKNEEVKGLVREYVNKKGLTRYLEWKDAAMEGMPFEKDGFVHINLENLRSHMNFTMDIRMKPMDIKHDLAESGFKYKSLGIRLENKTTTRGFWSIEEGALNNEHIPRNWAARDRKNDMAGGAGNESGTEVREQIDNDMQSHESSGA